MDIETIIDRFNWLTSSIFPSVVFFIVTMFETYWTNEIIRTDKLIAPILQPMLQYLNQGLWWFTAIIFLCFLGRSLMRI